MVRNQILLLSPDLETFLLLFSLFLMKISNNPYRAEKALIKINFVLIVVK